VGDRPPIETERGLYRPTRGDIIRETEVGEERWDPRG
jgi:hypothetical protein